MPCIWIWILLPAIKWLVILQVSLWMTDRRGDDFVQAWVTLSRAQLNFGEPELSVRSSKKALELQVLLKLDYLI